MAASDWHEHLAGEEATASLLAPLDNNTQLHTIMLPLTTENSPVMRKPREPVHADNSRS